MTETMPVVEGDLLDVNVWLALAIEEHPHHDEAASYWTRAGTTRFFCRLSAMSVVRLLTHPRLMSGKPLTLTKAWAVYRRFAELPVVSMLAEPDGFDHDLGKLVTTKLPSRLFTDAYFAALARKTGLRLVTFDRDFERIDQLGMLRLPARQH